MNHFIQLSYTSQKRPIFRQEPAKSIDISNPRQFNQQNHFFCQSQTNIGSLKKSKEPDMAFEDEYYGELQDFSAYEDKVMLRRNYEMMRVNTRSKTEVKRKKIFHPF